MDNSLTDSINVISNRSKPNDMIILFGDFNLSSINWSPPQTRYGEYLARLERNMTKTPKAFWAFVNNSRKTNVKPNTPTSMSYNNT
ncbi:uncharacterized protein LOC126563966 [Anopheles maculipalpis]|uniref:uncharacterized protein LOC126563966 n=1 Tax=Anopheles maculipalpis TaxID=1496333 RepID=UPI002158F80E|nr:uncharacterized protein LOC126563966 [Anopheles maculipalpis]